MLILGRKAKFLCLGYVALGVSGLGLELVALALNALAFIGINTRPSIIV